MLFSRQRKRIGGGGYDIDNYSESTIVLFRLLICIIFPSMDDHPVTNPNLSARGNVCSVVGRI